MKNFMRLPWPLSGLESGLVCVMLVATANEIAFEKKNYYGVRCAIACHGITS